MKRIKTYNFLISEKLGISTPSVKWCDIILDKVLESITTQKKFSGEIKIDTKEIVNSINIEEYKKFPVTSIELFLTTNKSKSISEISVSGGAYPFGHKNWKSYSRLLNSVEKTEFGIILKMDISVFTPLEYDKSELIDEINATVWHELNHLYEFYNRFLNIKGSIVNRAVDISLSYSDNNRWKIKNEIFYLWWSDFLYLIYISEPYEMNANVQECAYYVNKYGFDYLKNKKIYKDYLKLKIFNTEEFLLNLRNKISEFYEEDRVDYVINRLKMMFISEYESNIKSQNGVPIYNIEKMKKMNYTDFINLFQNRFIKSGNKVYKKLIRLATI